jgi:hypothetical protein
MGIKQKMLKLKMIQQNSHRALKPARKPRKKPKPAV